MADYDYILSKQLYGFCRGINIYTIDWIDFSYLRCYDCGCNFGIKFVSTSMLRDAAIILIDPPSYVLGFSMGPLVFAPMSEVCLIPFISF